MERNVKFNFEPDEVIVGDLPLEGEQSGDKCLPTIESEMMDQIDHPGPIIDYPGTIESTNRHISVENIPNRQENPVVNMEAPGGRSKQVQKETEYVRMLREGLAVTGMRGGMLPRGMQSSTSIIESEDVEHTMATVIERAQGLEPSYAEAKRCPDWPKWEEAIHKELKGLNNSGTWRLVKRPLNTNVVNSKWVFRIKKNTAGEIDKYKA